MLAKSMWAPVFSSESGLCLTARNWQEAQCNTAVYYLDALLLKPGINLLSNLSSLGQYTNWAGQVIINATNLKANKKGEIKLKSSYDGSMIALDQSQLIDLIKNLKPHAVILPSDILTTFAQNADHWDSNITPYFCSNNLPIDALPFSYGVYFSVNEEFTPIQQQLDQYKNYPRYIYGKLTYEQILKFNQYEAICIESDLPSEQGLNGLVYSSQGIVDIKEASEVLEFTKLSEECQCPTCSESLTRAYFHHLFAHTPLLAQRFLIQHNAYYVNTGFKNK